MPKAKLSYLANSARSSKGTNLVHRLLTLRGTDQMPTVYLNSRSTSARCAPSCQVSVKCQHPAEGTVGPVG